MRYTSLAKVVVSHREILFQDVERIISWSKIEDQANYAAGVGVGVKRPASRGCARRGDLPRLQRDGGGS